MIWYLVFGILLGGFVLAIVDFFTCPDDPPPARLPDCYGGIFTHEQATRYISMKAQYGAKLEDIAQPDSDENDTQMRAW